MSRSGSPESHGEKSRIGLPLPAVRFKPVPVALRKSFPFSVPALDGLKRLAFDSSVTFLCGENGSGKSTLIEALACTVRLPAIGNADVSRDATLSAVRPLADRMVCEWLKPARKGFFLRAEDFFGFVRRIGAMKTDLKEEKRNFSETLAGYGRDLAVSALEGQIAALDSRYGRDPDGQSHGESFLGLFRSRFVPDGLYLLDEPEAPLSPRRQLALLVLMKEMVDRGCQFIVATHSPILMAFPGAVIFDFDSRPAVRTGFDSLEHVKFTREFLLSPGRFLQHLWK